MERHQAAVEWLKSGRASRLPAHLSEGFDDYVHSLPWAGTTGLDWSRMPSSMQISTIGLSPEETYHWAQRTRLGSHEYVSVWYSRADGGIIVPLRDGVFALDELYLRAPGPRFTFGVDMRDGVVTPTFSDLLQYGNGDLLVATA